MKYVLATTAAALAIVSAGTAGAAVITLNTTIDLSVWNLAGSPIGMNGSADETVQFQSGDTVILDIDFLGDQTLQVDQVGRISGALSNGSPGIIPAFTGTMFLRNLSGPALATSYSNQNQICCNLGMHVFNGAFMTGSGPITFSGAVFTFENVQTGLAGNSPVTASGGRLDLDARNGVIGHLAGPTGVPEPSTWALLLSGFGGIGAMIRRRRSAVAAV